MKLLLKIALSLFSLSLIESVILSLFLSGMIKAGTFPASGSSDALFGHVIVLTLSIGILFSLINIALLYLLIIKPLDVIVKITKLISEGRMGSTIQLITGDETQEVANNINTIIKNLVSALQNMSNALGESKRNSVELAKKVEEVEKEQANDKALLTSIGDGVIAADEKGAVVFANKAAGSILGINEQEAVGKHIASFFISDEENHSSSNGKLDIISLMASAANERRNISQLAFYKHKDGNSLALSITASPVLIQSKLSGMILVFRDTTKQVEVDRMKTEFISLASHQLRTPLAAINWYSEMLLDGTGGPLNSLQGEMATNISLSTKRMIELVNALLNISRIESGRIIIDPKPTNIVSLVEELIKELEVKFKEKGQKLIISAHPNLPQIMIDPKLIRQVYMNLLTNAIKYTPKGGQVMVMISKKEDSILSQISDNGYGIPQSQSGHIFEKFFRAENVVKVETDGNGLGLYLVKSIIESSQGKIWFESKEGHGTTFWFTLPLSGMKRQEGQVTLDS